MSRKLRNIKPKKVNRGAFEEQKLREENKAETQRALLFILPLVMIAILAVGIFFGYKFYRNNDKSHGATAASETVSASVYEDDPIFFRTVTSANPLDEGYVPDTVEVCGVSMSRYAADSLERLVNAAKERGYDLIVREGYVPFEEQGERYEQAVADYRKSAKASLVKAEAHVRSTTPPAGESEQQTGLLVWLSIKTDGAFADTPAYSWLLRNGVDYGFVLRYPEKENAGGMAYSSHLFRFVGTENALKMRALDMNFDEYVGYLSAQ